MAGKPLNRLELRRQHDAAEPLDPMEDESEDLNEDAEDDDSESSKKPKKKAKAPSKAKSKTAKAAKPAARMRVVWTVMSDAFKPVATFEYSQKAAAETKAAELSARGKGTHFVVRTKEAMPDNAPGLGAAIPRAEPARPAASSKAKPAPVVEEDEEPEDEEADEEPETEEDADEE
jgi:hypothetical protein